jgi:hypothetical protein
MLADPRRCYTQLFPDTSDAFRYSDREVSCSIAIVRNTGIITIQFYFHSRGLRVPTCLPRHLAALPLLA